MERCILDYFSILEGEDRWRACVDIVLNFWVPQNVRNLLTSFWVFQTHALLHRLSRAVSTSAIPALLDARDSCGRQWSRMWRHSASVVSSQQHLDETVQLYSLFHGRWGKQMLLKEWSSKNVKNTSSDPIPTSQALKSNGTRVQWSYL